MSTRFGNYDLVALLGKGGMAEVFRAAVRSGDREGETVALKRLLPRVATSPTHLDLFLGEADLTRQLRHPAIVRVVDTGVVGDYYYIAMEYVEGTDVGHLLQRCNERGQAIPVALCCYIVDVVGHALNYAFTARSMTGEPLSVVHRDVTPENIFVSDQGEVRLGDFGVARAAGLGDPLEDGGVVGKPNYLAPEQLQREPLSADTDVYSLGVVLYELLTQEKPFPELGDDFNSILQVILNTEVRPPSSLRPEVPAGLDAVVMRALCSARGDPRFRSMLGTVRSGIGLGGGTRYWNTAQMCADIRMLYDPSFGSPLLLGAMVRELFGAAGATHRADRHDIALPATCETRSTLTTGATENVSASGAFIQLPMPPAIGEAVRVTLETPVGAVRTLGDVVWRRVRHPPIGCGVRFSFNDEASRLELRRIIDRLAVRTQRERSPVDEDRASARDATAHPDGGALTPGRTDGPTEPGGADETDSARNIAPPAPDTGFAHKTAATEIFDMETLWRRAHHKPPHPTAGGGADDDD